MNVRSQIVSNKRKTILVMVFFVVVVTVIAWVIAGTTGYGLSFIGIALIISGVVSFSSYWWSDKLVLTLSGARPADPQKDFDLYSVTENMAIAAGLPMPKVYVVDDPAPNAFATGRDPNHAVVVATTGLLARLDRSELEGVMAHEMSHVQNFDIRLMAIVTVLVGTIVYATDIYLRHMFWGGMDRRNDRSNGVLLLVGILVAVIAPIMATLIKLAISRNREYLADASAALLTRNPDALADALVKISADPNRLKHASNATAHMYISNPFKKDDVKNKLMGLFNTHPPMTERVKRLRSL